MKNPSLLLLVLVLLCLLSGLVRYAAELHRLTP